jgi:Ser/Thr protein kinase RdoA (MazF antagonist)
MRVLHVGPVLDEIFSAEPALPSRVDAVEQIHWDSTVSGSVFRVHAGAGDYVAHVAAEATEHLVRARNNIMRLAALKEPRIPRVVAWRQSGDQHSEGSEWAILILTRVPGSHLTRHTFSLDVWNDLKELICRVHLMPAGRVEPRAANRPVHEPGSFAGVVEALQGFFQLLSVPLNVDRVRRLLDDMSEYLVKHALRFQVADRLVHGDLKLENIVVDGSRAGLVDWVECDRGDYAYDLAMLKYSLDSTVPRMSSELLKQQAIEYRSRFGDETLELRLRFFMALPGLVAALSFPCRRSPERAWRVRTCFLHSEAQWHDPLQLDRLPVGAPAVATAHSPFAVRDPIRGLVHLLTAREPTRSP